MSHLVSYWWIRITQLIPELGVFYKNVGYYLEVLGEEVILVIVKFHF